MDRELDSTSITVAREVMTPQEIIDNATDGATETPGVSRRTATTRAATLAKERAKPIEDDDKGLLLTMGDFNCYDYLWGGDDVLEGRQGEADPIIDLMSEYSLRSLLLRGTKTWEKNDAATTIDLSLLSEELVRTVVRCVLYETDYGSDYWAIETTFDIAAPEMESRPRLLLKNALWK
ncbi:hypothetical protein CLIM01_14796 [Colletotrichum limetticola]|uniref:Endonuclease/exonuclease/phosphatase domain-containing protein n=1 Tax=Colletotrichum limetticola TaxID=1209924 RepID=A0ABQ9PBR9_9PEZI|nr:hypothetical protein CLIM01_14796 [Colletotrichum limetticola]